ncbi:hypothetical protein AAG906_037498 [Vitis piasezkii]
MKVFTKDRDLLRPRITRFATEFISLESFIRYEVDLKRMCTTNEWCEFNKDRSRKSLRDKVFPLMKKRKQSMKMMVLQIVEGVGGTVRVLEKMVALEEMIRHVMRISGENYYATQDINHEYRPGIWERQKHLERLTTFPSDDYYSSGHDYHRSNHHRIDEHLQNLGIGSRSYFRGVDDRSYHNFRDRDISSSTFSRNDFDLIHMDMINLLVAVALLIKVLDTINMVLTRNSLRNHIFLIMDHQANHLSQHIRVMNNSFNHILTTEIVTPICILIVGQMMMILNPLII